MLEGAESEADNTATPSSSVVDNTATSSSSATDAPPVAPDSAAHDPLNITDYTNTDQVFSNFLAWDGDEIFETDTLAADIVTRLKHQITVAC